MDMKDLPNLRKQIGDALSSIADGERTKGNLNIKLRLGNITYSGSGFRGTIHCDEITEDNLPARYKAEWDEAVGMELVKDACFGIVTSDKGAEYKVVGYDFKKRKNNILLQRQDNGKIYVTGLMHFFKPEFRHILIKKSMKKGLTLVDQP